MFGFVLFAITQGRMLHVPSFQDPFCQVALAVSGASVALAAILHRLCSRFLHRSFSVYSFARIHVGRRG